MSRSSDYRCPHCRAKVELDRRRGDFLPCPACSLPFWALDGEEEGRAFDLAAPRKGPLWSLWVVAVSLFVLAAELFLAGVIYGGTAWGICALVGMT